MLQRAMTDQGRTQQETEVPTQPPGFAPATLPIVGLLLATDLLAAAASFLLSFVLRKNAPLLSPLAHGIDLYLSVWPALFLWPLVLWREGLYPGFWLSAREELRRTVMGTTLASLLAVALTFVTKTGPQFSRPILVGGWLISMVLIPGARFLTRKLLTRVGLSGPHAVILGAGATAHIVVDGLRRQRPPALRPVALFDDDPKKIGQELDGLPIVGRIDGAGSWAQARGLHDAIIAMPGVPRDRLVPIIERQGAGFHRLLVVPDLFGLPASETDVHEIQGVLALELRKNLLFRRNRIAKRAIELVLLLLGAPIVLPLVGLIALAILLETGPPVFFSHVRTGRQGRVFRAWKFRTMVKGANETLATFLEAHPELREEWEATQKLKADPRLTRVGRLLRRLSLDELPQCWNILRGEMSLVGPRPIVEEEIPKYGASFDLYTQVYPGLTGLWQVSGRSDLSYQDRVWLDTHYVRNWSVWLDLVILVRTIWVVIAGIGAY